jgi:hypothetical protein
MSGTVQVTVAIATRDWGESTGQTLQSEAGSSYKHLDVVVIDHTPDYATELSVRQLIDDRPTICVRPQTTGLLVARDPAAGPARRGTIAFTDDAAVGQANPGTLAPGHL